MTRRSHEFANCRYVSSTVNSYEQYNFGKNARVSENPTVQAHAWQGYWPHIMHSPRPQV